MLLPRSLKPSQKSYKSNQPIKIMAMENIPARIMILIATMVTVTTHQHTQHPNQTAPTPSLIVHTTTLQEKDITVPIEISTTPTIDSKINRLSMKPLLRTLSETQPNSSTWPMLASEMRDKPWSRPLLMSTRTP
jgi:hypothetical protein